MKRVPGTFAVSGGGLAARRKYCLMSNVPETLALYYHIGLIKGEEASGTGPRYHLSEQLYRTRALKEDCAFTRTSSQIHFLSVKRQPAEGR